MRTKLLPLVLLSLLSFHFLQAQNYLRVADPDGWDAVNSSLPDWHEYAAHGVFDEVTIIVEPQGIFTEIGFYATISQGPGAWSGQGEYEIIWQFELPSNTIVHDSWLWVEQDIVKADVVDFWTALETYEGIVNRNEDPSLLYQLQDNRYEIRIYPLFEGETRRVKMSFLVPTDWEADWVASDLLHNLLQGTDYPPEVVNVGVPINDVWKFPSVNLDGQLTHLPDTVTGGSGNLLHYITLDGEDLAAAEVAELMMPAPYSGEQSFLSTYSEAGQHYFQLAFAPDWEGEIRAASAKKSLILLDYNPMNTGVGKPQLMADLQVVLAGSFSSADSINIAVNTTDGIAWLSENWWGFDEAALPNMLSDLLAAQNSADLELLLSDGFAWAQDCGDVSEIILLAANEEYFYPPAADAVFANLQAEIPAELPFTLIDYQDENVSVIFYNGTQYHGNEYFFDLLANGFVQAESLVMRELGMDFGAVIDSVLPAFIFPSGIMDFYTTLDNGVCYQRYSLNDIEVTPQNRGVILQTGKYVGDFPMHIDANFITDEGHVWNLTHTFLPDEIVPGDTLMREMWFGPHLKNLEAQSSSAEDLLEVIEASINERVLTGLTAFLALDPSQGAEPCIDCLYNDGGGFVTIINELDSAAMQLTVSPNPATDFAEIQLTYPEALQPSEWNAAIFEVTGRQVINLGHPNPVNGGVAWQWEIGPELKAGLYFYKITSDHGEFIGKIMVL